MVAARCPNRSIKIRGITKRRPLRKIHLVGCVYPPKIFTRPTLLLRRVSSTSIYTPHRPRLLRPAEKRRIRCQDKSSISRQVTHLSEPRKKTPSRHLPPSTIHYVAAGSLAEIRRITRPTELVCTSIQLNFYKENGAKVIISFPGFLI